MTEATTARDRRVKHGLLLAIVAGLVIGFAIGTPRYGVMDPSTWNLAGLTVIGTVGLYTLALLATALRRANRDEAS